MRGASISLLFIILLAAISDAHSTNKFGQSPSSSESEPQFKAPAGATGPRPSENVLGKEPWCGPLVRGLTTTIAEGKHIRFCWRDDPAAVMRPLQVDTESINRVTEVLTQLNMQPKPFSSHGLGHINVRIFPPSREMEDGGMFTARVPVYPDDDLDTLADEVQEEYLLPPASMLHFRDEVRQLFHRRGVTLRDASSGILVKPLVLVRHGQMIDFTAVTPPPPGSPDDVLLQQRRQAILDSVITPTPSSSPSTLSSASLNRYMPWESHPLFTPRSSITYSAHFDLSKQDDSLLTSAGIQRKRSKYPIVQVSLLPNYDTLDLSTQLGYYLKLDPSIKTGTSSSSTSTSSSIKSILDQQYNKGNISIYDSNDVFIIRIVVEPRLLARAYSVKRSIKLNKINNQKLNIKKNNKNNGANPPLKRKGYIDSLSSDSKSVYDDIISKMKGLGIQGDEVLPEDASIDNNSSGSVSEYGVDGYTQVDEKNLYNEDTMVRLEHVTVMFRHGDSLDDITKVIGRVLLLDVKQREVVKKQIGQMIGKIGMSWKGSVEHHRYQWLRDFNKKEWRLTSQNGEDGVIDWIFYNIGTTNRYYVEFGAEKGRECNTQYLREHRGWTGLLIDGGYRDGSINLRQEVVNSWNINHLFEKYHVPSEFDLLSIDLDYADYYVWKALDGEKYRPRVVIMEVNAVLGKEENKVVEENDPLGWRRDDHYGCSLKAATALAKQKGYTLVYHESRGVNAFFIRDDILGMTGKSAVLPYNKIYKKVNHYNGRTSIHTRFNNPDINKQRKWIYNDLPNN